jgi:hypothetical protein
MPLRCSSYDVESGRSDPWRRRGFPDQLEASAQGPHDESRGKNAESETQKQECRLSQVEKNKGENE